MHFVLLLPALTAGPFFFKMKTFFKYIFYFFFWTRETTPQNRSALSLGDLGFLLLFGLFVSPSSNSLCLASFLSFSLEFWPHVFSCETFDSPGIWHWSHPVMPGGSGHLSSKPTPPSRPACLPACLPGEIKLGKTWWHSHPLPTHRLIVLAVHKLDLVLFLQPLERNWFGFSLTGSATCPQPAGIISEEGHWWDDDIGGGCADWRVRIEMLHSNVSIYTF